MHRRPGAVQAQRVRIVVVRGVWEGIDRCCACCKPETPPDGPVVYAERFIAGLPDRMRSIQDQFDLTGSVHAAAVFDSHPGELIASAEDVGRHNAVDKVVGELASKRWPIGEAVLVVSGRIGFEIVQKAAVAGIPVVCGISGASSLAASLGEESGVTVVGFLRGESFSVYSGGRRIDG